MAIYNLIYGSTADTFGESSTSATYTTVRNSTASTAANAASGTTRCTNTFSSPNYIQGQIFLVFDMSTVPAGAGTGLFSFNLAFVPVNTNADTIRIRGVSTVANKIAGGSLSALTLHSDPGTFPTATGRYTAAISDVSVIPRSAAFNVVLYPAGQESATGPTAGASFTISAADTAGTTSDPFISITVGTPWSFVGVSASVEATTTAITLAEPAGVADGDLLVACFASRSTATTAITNTGWTAVNSQNNNNALTTTSALASGTMLYQIRAGAPDLSFVIPAGISVCLGRIVAYRGAATTTPLDASTAVTTATNTLAVNVAGLTTTQDDDLIVAMAAGGQEATWSAFSNVTTPLTASGATDTTTAPSPTAWIERAEQVTTTGNDTSLAIFDAVRTGTGATGNLTATASLGAGHVVIAGAFKIKPSAVAIPGVKVWSGSAWAEKPAKVWTGSTWTQKPVKTWNGSAWI